MGGEWDREPEVDWEEKKERERAMRDSTPSCSCTVCFFFFGGDLIVANLS